MSEFRYFNSKNFENELLKKYNLRLEQQNSNLCLQFKILNNQYTYLSKNFENKINTFINNNLLEFQQINNKNIKDYNELKNDFNSLINNYKILKKDYLKLKLEYDQNKKNEIDKENQSILYNLKFFSWL